MLHNMTAQELLPSKKQTNNADPFHVLLGDFFIRCFLQVGDVLSVAWAGSFTFLGQDLCERVVQTVIVDHCDHLFLNQLLRLLQIGERRLYIMWPQDCLIHLIR